MKNLAWLIQYLGFVSYFYDLMKWSGIHQISHFFLEYTYNFTYLLKNIHYSWYIFSSFILKKKRISMRGIRQWLGIVCPLTMGPGYLPVDTKCFSMHGAHHRVPWCILWAKEIVWHPIHSVTPVTYWCTHLWGCKLHTMDNAWYVADMFRPMGT